MTYAAPFQYQDTIPDHLGGYTPGGDPRTTCPSLWDWLAGHVRSMLDIGCGDGATLDAFAARGVDAWGVDGVPQDHPRIHQHDYTTGPWTPKRRFDLGWCAEVVEHIEERYVAHLVATFKTCDLLLMTHALPGQSGHHHVNCREPQYWVDVLSPWFSLDEPTTYFARGLCDRTNFFARSGLALRRLGRKPRAEVDPADPPMADVPGMRCYRIIGRPLGRCDVLEGRGVGSVLWAMLDEDEEAYLLGAGALRLISDGLARTD